MLVLDEATSHLDVGTERLVDRNLSELSCTRTVAAHRLSTILNADLILVLDGGTIVERGPIQSYLPNMDCTQPWSTVSERRSKRLRDLRWQ